MSAPAQLPPGVERKARALGPAGERWLDELPSIVRGICADWDIEVGDALDGGSGGFVAQRLTATACAPC